MLRTIIRASLIVITLCILSSCGGKDIATQYVYVPCNVPEIPEKPKYFRSQVQGNINGMIEFKGHDDVKGILVNDLMNRSHIEELRTILEGMKEKK